MAFADGNIIIGTSVDVGGMNTGLYKIQKAMKRWTRVLGVGLVAGLYKVGKAAVEATSDLQEIQNVVDVAFTDMSYKIEEFSKICIEHFGMAEISAKQTAGSFMAMGKSIGITEQAASDMAVELTGLTGDFASFYNISQAYAKIALSAIYTGETETIKRYGIILTEANLQEYALTQGITKKVKAMSAEEKTLLRYNYVMKATEHLHGDFERTQKSWANTLRVLKERWTQLLSVVGAGAIHVIQPFISMLSSATSKLMFLVKYINALLGITAEIDTVDVTHNMEDLGDAVEETGSKIHRSLASFDKLNNLTAGSSDGDDVTSDIEKLYEQFQLSGYVIDAMQNWETQIDTFSITVQTAISDLVDYIGDKKEALEKVIQDIKDGDWFDVGYDFGSFIHDFQTDIESALAKVDWESLGEKIGAYFEGIVWSDALFGWISVLTTAIEGVITAAAAAVDKVTISDIVKLSKSVSNMATTIFKRIRSALKKVKWKKLGERVGTFLRELKWKEILSEAAKALWEGLSDALELAAGIFEAAPVASAFATAVVAAIAISDWIGLKDALERSATLAIKKWKKAQGAEGLSKILAKTMGVISILLSVAVAIASIRNVKEGEYGWRSARSIWESLTSAVLAGLGLGVVVGSATVGIIAGAAVLALSLALKYIFEPSSEEQQKIDEARIHETIKNLSWYKDFNEAIDVVVNFHVKAGETISDTESTIDAYTDIANKWYDLSQNEDDLTESQKILLQLYSNQLTKVMPDVVSLIDDVTNAYKGTRKQLDMLIDSTREYMYMQVYDNLSVEALEDLIRGERELGNLQKKRNQLQRKEESLFNEYDMYGNGGARASSVSKSLAKKIWKTLYGTSIKRLDDTGYAATGKHYRNEEELAVYIGELLRSTIKSGKQDFTVTGLKFKLSDIKFDWDSQLEDETIWDLVLAIKDVDTQSSEAQKLLDEFEDDIEYYATEKAKKFENFTKTNKEFKDSLEKSAENTVEGVTGTITSKKTKQEVNDAGKETFTEVQRGYNEKAQIKSPSKVMKKSGKYTVEGIIAGIEDTSKRLISVAQSLVDSLVDVFNSANIRPTITFVPAIDMASFAVPNIVSGSVIPASMTAATSVSSSNGGMSKKELSSVILNAVKSAISELRIHSTFDVNGDPQHIFNVVQTEAIVYTKRTGNLPF